MRARLRTLEAMALAIVARALVRFVPLARWKHLLGESQSAPPGASGPSGPPLNAGVNPSAQKVAQNGTDLAVRQCVAAVRRAALRLPATLCLPQAMALHWMLARRGIESIVTIGFLPVSQRGTRDDLHAWVDWQGITVLGDSGGTHASLLQFKKNFASRNCKTGTV